MSIQTDDFFTPINESGDDFFTPINEPSRAASLASAPIKGAIKGAVAQTSISPFHNVGPVPGKLGERLLDKFLPTKESPIEGTLERAGKIGSGLALGGPGGLVRKGITSLVGGLAGETTKQLGGGELAQSIAELGAMATPDLAKTIPGKAAQGKVLEFLRRRGYSENEITPLIQSPQKLARFAKFASKGEKTDKLMRDIYGKFDNVYSSIREKGQQFPGLKGEQVDEFLGDFQKQFDKVPKMFQRMIKEEVNDLLNSEMKFTDFVDLEQAINARIKGTTGGKAVLGILKEATNKAKNAISPELTEEMSLANELYGKRIDVSKHLRTREIDDLIDLGEAGAVMAGVADGNLGILGKVLTVSGGRALAREMLINPRLQNISLRMLNAVKKNKLPIVSKLYDIFKQELKKKNEKIAEELPEFDLGER